LKARGIILAILAVVSTILVVGVSVVRASELASAKMSILGLPIAITAVATLTLAIFAVRTIYNQRMTTTQETENVKGSCGQTLNYAMSTIAEPTWPSETNRMAYPNYCDRCGQQLA
jgi:hypothetical protein